MRLGLCLMSVVSPRESRKSCGEACSLKKLGKSAEYAEKSFKMMELLVKMEEFERIKHRYLYSVLEQHYALESSDNLLTSFRNPF